MAGQVAGWWLGPQRRDFRAWERFMGEWAALQESPFFALWAGAAIDEMLSALHERLAVGRGRQTDCRSMTGTDCRSMTGTDCRSMTGQ